MQLPVRILSTPNQLKSLANIDMYLSSAIIMNCFAQDATIFSWVKQPLNKDKLRKRTMRLKNSSMTKQGRKMHV